MATDEAKLPGTLADLHLPPTFVADHCIRTLASQGAMTLVELAKHWRVPGEVAAQALEPPKAAGLIETETNRSSIEALQKWRLSANPRPVPPYLRVVEASACMNSSNKPWSCSGLMPMPVSVISKTTQSAATQRVPGRRAAVASLVDC